MGMKNLGTVILRGSQKVLFVSFFFPFSFFFLRPEFSNFTSTELCFVFFLLKIILKKGVFSCMSMLSKS